MKATDSAVPTVAGKPVLSPLDPGFWNDAGNAWDWVRFVWRGPDPVVELNLSNVYREQRFSSQTIYQSIITAVERLKLPGTKCEPQVIHEGGRFSPFRVYLQIRREFSEFLVCAAPVGESFFLTVRRIDRFPHVKWFHYLLAAGFVGLLACACVVAEGILPGLVLFCILLSLAWSVMRYAACATGAWLREHLHEVPILGPLYLRWFRPDTYFRQDLHAAFLSLVDGVIKEVVEGLQQGQVIRPATEQQGGPIVPNLHEQG